MCLAESSGGLPQYLNVSWVARGLAGPRLTSDGGAILFLAAPFPAEPWRKSLWLVDLHDQNVWQIASEEFFQKPLSSPFRPEQRGIADGIGD